MKAFVVKFEKFFKLDTDEKNNMMNFHAEKRRLLIPCYQREYIWSNEKIETLVNDINSCDKYLGNIILDETKSWYEIIDGQQRITTCFLILACLYNFYHGHQKEQFSLMKLMKPYDDRFILQNDTIGEFIFEKDGLLYVDIDEKKDIYYQKRDFERAFSAIKNILERIVNEGKTREFKQKLLECEMLVLIHDQHNHTHPVEQLFLDINEKAQLLQPEDIFKGHCFENYEEYAHDELRDLWIGLKKCAMGFVNKFGFKDASEYLYLYLLEADSLSISKHLILEGRHYLDKKTMDDTEQIIKEMIIYGQTVLNFFNNLYYSDYRFVDLCDNCYEYRNTDDHIILKQMCKIMLQSSGAQYQKLPFMYFIYALRKNQEIVYSMSYKQFRMIITNLYIYMMLFIISGVKKSKDNIDHTIRNALNKKCINDVIISARDLRVKMVKEFSLRSNYGFDKLSFMYSVIDEYNAKDNWIKNFYSRENGYTLEHFIIPDNRNRKISWKDNEDSFEFILQMDVVRLYKRETINYLIIDKKLNESLEHDDIVSKIYNIKLWYRNKGEKLPAHVSIIIDCIEDMPKYQELEIGKGKGLKQHDIEAIYLEFINDYFESNSKSIQEKIEQEFRRAFQNS